LQKSKKNTVFFWRKNERLFNDNHIGSDLVQKTQILQVKADRYCPINRQKVNSLFHSLSNEGALAVILILYETK